MGSIPTAVWVARIWKKIDIREHGSKNAGLTNVFRVLGWKPALPVVFIDLLKGFMAPYLAGVVDGGVHPWLPFVAGLLAILGHSFTCFAGFRGGKGVLTAMGVFLALHPVLAITCFSFWVLLTVTTKYVSVGSIGACSLLAILGTVGFVFPDFAIPGRVDIGVLALCWLVGIFVIVKHRANMVRLWNGTENGFGSKRKTSAK
jgi:acyl phosphate:glycerol-3-phosphate acyltransferase